jgi:hypothetical protein
MSKTTAKEFLDKKYGDDRVHARNLPSILEEYSKIRIKEDSEELVDKLKLILERAGSELSKELIKKLIKKYENEL